MANTQTADQIRAECVAAMPGELGEAYYALYNQVAWLHLKWKDFRELYEDSQETLDLLNVAAPRFFHNVQRLMWEDVLLHLCRLTDPAKSAGKDTLTVRRIGALISDHKLRSQVQTRAGDANRLTKFARDWRNRRLAHTALPPMDGGHPTPLAHASRQNVEDALEAIRDTLNLVANHYLNSTVSYEHSVQSIGNVSTLIAKLKKLE